VIVTLSSLSIYAPQLNDRPKTLANYNCYHNTFDFSCRNRTSISTKYSQKVSPNHTRKILSSTCYIQLVGSFVTIFIIEL